MRPGILFIVSAPSGAGKTTLVHGLVKRDPNVVLSISHTTRRQRPGEVNGVHYHFIDDAAFGKMVEKQAFLEHAPVFDHQYGTSKHWVEARLAEGRDVILEIDWQGARQVRSRGADPISIFVLPPSLHILEQRLRTRGEDDTVVARRMRDAISEISHYAEYDFLVVNDAVDRALLDLGQIMDAARHCYRPLRLHFDAAVAELLRDAGDIR
ncbi:MAG: guanylate kinase [Gammaproteobacteria bacterium]|nr:guanylate kinase [Gammaproteobacteria bacterium]